MDMGLICGRYQLTIAEGGIEVTKGDTLLYFNKRPLCVTVKTRFAISEFFEAKYQAVSEKEGGLLAEGSIETPTGAVFAFQDSFTVTKQGFCLARKVKIVKASQDYGFSSKFSLVMKNACKPEDFNCFAPGVWYKHNEYAPKQVIGKDLDCEYFWKMETNMALPLFAMQHISSGESICLSRWAADMTLRNVDIARSENNVDEKLTTGALGMSKPSSQTLNYLYYGYAVRTNHQTEVDGLSIDYVYPGADGQLPQERVYAGLDFREKPMTFRRLNHPMREGFEQNYSIGIHVAQQDNFQDMMRENWRICYERLRDDFFPVDNEQYFHDCIKLLSTYTGKYGDAYGLPFACQLPDMDVSSVSFQFGFVGQQPGIGYMLLRYGKQQQNNEI